MDTEVTRQAPGFRRRRSTGSGQLLVEPGASTSIAEDGDDVSTALGHVVDDRCGIVNVATPPERRGRGCAAAVTAHAVRTAMAGGARAAYLQASPMGPPVYQRLGFVTVEEWRQWIPEEYAEPG